MKIDILYLAHGRPEFTAASLAALADNTNWDLVNTMVVYTDSQEQPVPIFSDPACKVHLDCNTNRYGGPVPVMQHFLGFMTGAPAFIKLDNDVIVPPGWLEQCVGVMEAHPQLDLLGIEPPLSRTANPATGKRGPWPEMEGSRAPTDAVGGIGLFRRSAFAGRPLTSHSGGRGGFTDWQLRHKDVTKGWIVPPLKLFLLDRLIAEPWASLSRKYEADGIQRPWTRYTAAEQAALADWWLAAQ